MFTFPAFNSVQCEKWTLVYMASIGTPLSALEHPRVRHLSPQYWPFSNVCLTRAEEDAHNVYLYYLWKSCPLHSMRLWHILRSCTVMSCTAFMFIQLYLM